MGGSKAENRKNKISWLTGDISMLLGGFQTQRAPDSPFTELTMTKHPHWHKTGSSV